jgi:hypothetical protein
MGLGHVPKRIGGLERAEVLPDPAGGMAGKRPGEAALGRDAPAFPGRERAGAGVAAEPSQGLGDAMDLHTLIIAYR